MSFVTAWFLDPERFRNTGRKNGRKKTFFRPFFCSDVLVGLVWKVAESTAHSLIFSENKFSKKKFVMEKKILNFFLLKKSKFDFFKKIFFFRFFFSMMKKYVFFEFFLFEKIKVCTVDSATFYPNPTKISLLKIAPDSICKPRVFG